jgi:hypothetical protein
VIGWLVAAVLWVLLCGLAVAYEEEKRRADQASRDVARLIRDGHALLQSAQVLADTAEAQQAVSLRILRVALPAGPSVRH